MGAFESKYSELRDEMVVELDVPDTGVCDELQGVNFFVYRCVIVWGI